MYSQNILEIPNISLPSIELQIANNDYGYKFSIQAVSNMNIFCIFFFSCTQNIVLTYVAMENDIDVQSTDFSMSQTLIISTFLMIKPQPQFASPGGLLHQILEYHIKCLIYFD